MMTRRHIVNDGEPSVAVQRPVLPTPRVVRTRNRRQRGKRGIASLLVTCQAASTACCAAHQPSQHASKAASSAGWAPRPAHPS